MEISLKAARVNAGMTQKEVAKALNVSKSTILSYEKYRTIPDVNTAKKLAALYGITVNDIFFTV